MTFLTDDELRSLRVEVIELLPDTCRILRRVDTNNSGYISSTWGTAVATAACRFDPESLLSERQVVSDRLSNITTYQVTLEYDTDIEDGDRVVYDGGTYSIRQLHEAHSARLFRRVRVERIRGE